MIYIFTFLHIILLCVPILYNYWTFKQKIIRASHLLVISWSFLMLLTFWFSGIFQTTFLRFPYIILLQWLLIRTQSDQQAVITYLWAWIIWQDLRNFLTSLLSITCNSLFLYQLPAPPPCWYLLLLVISWPVWNTCDNLHK